MTPGEAGGLLDEPLKGVVDFLKTAQSGIYNFIYSRRSSSASRLWIQGDDGRFIQSHCEYTVTPSPKILARKILCPFPQAPGRS